MKYLFFLFLMSCSSKETPPDTTVTNLPSTLMEAVQNPLRSQDFMARDKYRHPFPTLNFFGVAPEMTVIEIWPSGGWYSEILAPYLAMKGKYIIADPPSDPKGYTNRRKEWMARNPGISAHMWNVSFLPPDEVTLGEKNSADMVLTFRNIHNWSTPKDKAAAFKAFFHVLKKGGILGVVEHRAKKGMDPKSGYVLESDVIAMAQKAGFKLDAQSEINANPKDLKNYPDGVWTLPPTLKLGDRDRAKYLEIGESDRMTLRFIKP